MIGIADWRIAGTNCNVLDYIILRDPFRRELNSITSAFQQYSALNVNGTMEMSRNLFRVASQNFNALFYLVVT